MLKPLLRRDLTHYLLEVARYSQDTDPYNWRARCASRFISVPYTVNHVAHQSESHHSAQLAPRDTAASCR